MKKYYWLIVVALLFQACNQKSPKELIVGTWKLDDIKYEREISEDIKPILEAQIQALRETFWLEYHADGSYHSHSVKDENGTWVINDDGTELRHLDAEGEQYYKVLTLTEKSLQLKTILDKDTFSLHFIPK